MPMNTLKDLLVSQLNELYAAERHASKAMPDFAKCADSPELAAALRRRGESCKDRLLKLDEAFREAGARPHPARAETEGMKGLIRDCLELAKAAKSEPVVRDAAIIAGVQHVAHDQIAGYGCARTWAEILGFPNAVSRLQLALTEERKLDAELSAIAAKVNRAATVSGV